MSRSGDDPVHSRRQREGRRNVARLMNVIAVRAAVDSGLELMPGPGRGEVPHQRERRPVEPIPRQRSTPPEE